MLHPCTSVLGTVLILFAASQLELRADDKKLATPIRQTAADKSVEQIAASARNSIVVITFVGRDGKRQGLGTGFVISSDGLIATNLHVLGEARPITVQLADGKRHEVTSIHASDRAADLAIVHIDAKDLTPLLLGDSDKLKEGQAIVALGNPRGLANSVVAGVVSARRQLDGRSMIQVAMPIEPGNSGGPVLDLQGRVQGILTMKSAVTNNLGFAMPINALKPLLKKPNPIQMARWLTIGALDPVDWKTVFEGHWKQRAGRVVAEGFGSGFGGRTLCLWQHPLPALPYEVAVTVRLDDEAGAAGLAFHADGGDRHYGFYPSGGQLRLTRFDGPDVFSWTILKQLPSPHYRPGDWNMLKVRLEKDRMRCYVNGHLLVETSDDGLTGGRVGLAKFRDTRAEFRNFRVAQKITEPVMAGEVARRLDKEIASAGDSGTFKSELVDGLLKEGPAGVALLHDRARDLDRQAEHLRALADFVQERQVQKELARVFQSPEDQVDLVEAALLVAKLDNSELDVSVYRQEIERMVRAIQSRSGKDADDRAKLDAINRYLFEEQGFHGSRGDYYNRSNSYLNEVLEDREGLPITLSVLYMELARRLGVKVVGINMPGHFVVKHVPAKGEGELIDVFDGARPLPLAEARDRVKSYTEREPEEADFVVAGKKTIIIRILTNLMELARQEGTVKGMLRYLDTILVISPDAANERLLRAGARFQSGDRQGAVLDVDWLLEHRPTGINLERVEELRRLLSR
jgi:regulator of sirC expression with transglutaminase-like and TPR domain